MRGGGFPSSRPVRYTLRIPSWAPDDGARHSPVAVRLARRSMHQGVQLDLRNALHLDLALYQQTVGSEDRREGVNAFNEKRTPHFKGR